MNNMNIILATSNISKIKEFKEIFQNVSNLNNVKIYSMIDLGYNLDPEETADDFKGNAFIKSNALWDSLVNDKNEIFDENNDIVLSDDSGLMIDYLGGEPGVKSARYLGDVTYRQRFDYIINKMKNIKGKDRSCKFLCTLCMIKKDKTGTKVIEYFEGKVDGEISEKIVGTSGFGYDPIFYIPSLKKTLAELEGVEKNSMSHRKIAINQFISYITNIS